MVRLRGDYSVNKNKLIRLLKEAEGTLVEGGPDVDHLTLMDSVGEFTSRIDLVKGQILNLKSI